MTRFILLLLALATPASAETFNCPEPRIAKDVDSGTCGNGAEFRIGVGTPNDLWFDGLELRCERGREGKEWLQAELDAGTPMQIVRKENGRLAKAGKRQVVRLGWFAWKMHGKFGRVVFAEKYEHGTCEID